jgi:hypothetical protein
MKPTIGRIVIYNTTQQEQEALTVLGNNTSKQLPAVIVAVWGESEQSAVNLKVMVDGKGADIWKTSLSASEEKDEDGNLKEGSWHWPVINK